MAEEKNGKPARKPAVRKAATPRKPATRKPRATRPEITRADIERRAYELYLTGTGGDAFEHWLRAERELVGA
jgi:hypothetical protein